MKADDVTQHTVTALLHRWKAGDQAAHDALLPMVYGHLRRLAQRSLFTERRDHTLQHTALVHEAYLELVRMDVAWNDRAHFFALAARAMRRILVDHARTRNRQKRGSGAEHVPLDEAANQPAPSPHVDIVSLDDALERLAAIDPRKSDMLEMRYFGGLKQEELSDVLGVSLATVNRDLAWAKAWLKSELAL
ncbi:MAG: sigma-70 family RNA polymerase sigma factor [Vicinamibacterales bacterium]